MALIAATFRVPSDAGGRPLKTAPRSRMRLLRFMLLHQFLDLFLYRLEIEGRRRLHRRIIDGRHRQLTHVLLDHHEAPELACVEVIHVAPAHVVRSLAADGRRPLEWILTDVHDGGHVGRHFLPGPAVRLLEKLEFEIIDTHCAEMRAAEVEDLVARRWSFTQQKVHLVVTVKVIFIFAAADIHSFQELLCDVRVAGGGREGGQPVEARENAVLNDGGFDMSRPADNRGYAEAAFENSALGRSKRRHAAVRPGEYFGAIVGREDNDSVVGLADILEVP